METTLTTNNAAPTLVDIRLDSKRYPRVATMGKEQLTFELGRIIRMATLYKGHRIDDEGVNFTAAATADEIMGDKAHSLRVLTLTEIELVIKERIFSEDFYLSVANIINALRTYTAGEGLKAAKAAQKIIDERAKAVKAAQLQELAPVIAVGIGKMIGR